MAKRVDSNQAIIVKALRDAGCSVCDLHEVGKGVPDILVGVGGKNGETRRNYLFEIKAPGGTMNEREWKFFHAWGGQIDVIRSAEDAFRIMGMGV